MAVCKSQRGTTVVRPCRGQFIFDDTGLGIMRASLIAMPKARSKLISLAKICH